MLIDYYNIVKLLYVYMYIYITITFVFKSSYSESLVSIQSKGYTIKR